MAEDDEVFQVGEAYVWAEQGTSIQLKAVTEFGDPVELTAEEAGRLAQVLTDLAKSLDE
ncbi:MAG: hypothetical protein JOZ02_21345 [Acidobacteria bacterium]|nr:hypothetical protein [Acidobacteriota bacterium]